MELQAAKRDGAKVLDDAAAMQHVRIAEAQLSKMALKLSHAQQLQGTYRALVAQMDKDKAHLAAQLEGVARALSRAEGEVAKLRERERASSTRRSETVGRLEGLRAEVAQQREDDAATRRVKAAAVDAASDTDVRTTIVCRYCLTMMSANDCCPEDTNCARLLLPQSYYTALPRVSTFASRTGICTHS